MDELFEEDESSTTTRSRSQSLDFSNETYGHHLRDVLGSEHSESLDGEDEEEEIEMEIPLTIDSLQLDHLTVPQTVSSLVFISFYSDVL